MCVGIEKAENAPKQPKAVATPPAKPQPRKRTAKEKEKDEKESHGKGMSLDELLKSQKEKKIRSEAVTCLT